MFTGAVVQLVRAVLRDAGLGQEGLPTGHRDLELMSGGVDASTFLVHRAAGDVVVKLEGTGLEAESGALRAWSSHSHHVPDVLGFGRLAQGGCAEPVPYLVLEVLRDHAGGVAPTASELLEATPDLGSRIGEALGAELCRLHEAVHHEGFGNFGDSPGAERTYDSWGAYLSDYLGLHRDFVTATGVSDRRLRLALDALRDTSYDDAPRLLHGDVSVRNLAVYQRDPLAVGLFDPNPLGGDPSWDLAPVANKAALGDELCRRGGESGSAATDAAVWSGLQAAYGALPDGRMVAAQLVQAVLQAEARHHGRGDGDLGEREVAVADDFVRELVDRLVR
ncbi:MAG: phosphotransferase [Dermatophilaceae bacterium]|nr:phosphotransferase [Dermatophilaceae bacterium]